MTKTITVVCPAYNEAESIEEFYKTLKSELDSLSNYIAHILFVIDGGTDATFEIVQDIAKRDVQVQAIKLSRNFGHQMALLAGIDHARGDVVITMDSDLQHPPRLIPKLLAEYERGSEIVLTIRERNEGVGVLRRLAGVMFYRMAQFIADVPISENASDYRLISKRVADILRTDIRERNLFLRGMIGWIGFTQSSVPFTADKRFAGASKYSVQRNIQFALSGLVSFSKNPLRAASAVGLAVALLSFLFGVFTVVQYLLGATLVSGWATVVILVSFFGGVQLIFLGILGEYIGIIFDEVKARPHYLVDERIRIE